jgi:valyl-tRNA synthetase
MARVTTIESGNGSDVAGKGGAHAVLRAGGELYIPLEGLIDVGRERERLTKELTRLDGQLRGTEAKLTNEQFVGKAPPDIIQRERDKLASLREQVGALSEKLKALE